MNIELNRPAQIFAAAAAALVITWVMSWGFVDATRMARWTDRAEAIAISASADAGSSMVQVARAALLK